MAKELFNSLMLYMMEPKKENMIPYFLKLPLSIIVKMFREMVKSKKYYL